jgi:phosphorylcholine metabolism protein LicD
MNWIIILLIIIYAVIYYYKKLKLQYKSKCLDLNFWKNKYGEHQKKLLNFIQQIQKYLEKHNIKYWAHAGTLLGQVRHNGFIPWDDDVDFGYLNELDIISNMLDELKSNGYIITKEFFGYKVYSPFDKKIFIDLFEFNIENNQAVQTIESNKTWPKENYYLNKLFPLKNDNFENIKIPIPSNPNDFCSRAFGSDYMDIFYIQFPHYDMFLHDINDGLGILSKCINNKFEIKDLKI